MRCSAGCGADGDAGHGLLPIYDRTAAHPQALLIESLIGGLPGPAIVLDRDGRVIAFNAAASVDRAGAAPRRAGA